MSEIQYFHPFILVGFKNYPDESLCEYGFKLDLTTELSLYVYDMGWGLNFRVLGFGFHYVRL